MGVVVKQLNAGTNAAWDRFVEAHAEGTFCHRAGWKTAIEQGAGHDCPYLIAEQDGAIVGVLPLTVRKSWLFGSAVTSNMFGVYGGPLVAEGAALEALDSAARDIMRKAGCGALEYRSRRAQHAGHDGWQQEASKSATFQTRLAADEEGLLLAIPRKQRAVVRKSLTKGLRTEWTTDLKEFYALYAESVRNLGTPVFPFKLFAALQASFGEQILVQITRNEQGQAVASLLSFLDRDIVLPYYAGGNVVTRQYHAHDFMYFELMKKAVSLGRTQFDFGRSKVDTGPYKFKKNWGFEPSLLEYEYFLEPGHMLPDTSPQNPKYRAMIAVWKRLPLWLANLLGPSVARHLG